MTKGMCIIITPPITYRYVDLGLPSGTKWAAQNVGARKPSDAGLYFQWGDTSGYTYSQIGKDKQFNWSDYKFSINGSDTNFSKYATAGTTLELEDDAAHINMGGNWHMPTPEQIKELTANTTTAWTSNEGVNGITFTSKKDSSKSIFIPAAGSARNGSIFSSGINGLIWSFILFWDNVSYGQYLVFYSASASLNYTYRCDGLSVRGVIG